MQRKRPAGGESQAKPPEYRRDAPHTDGGGGSGNLSACAQRIWWWHQSIPKRSPLRCRIPLPLSLHIHRLALAFSRQLRGFFFFFLLGWSRNGAVRSGEALLWGVSLAQHRRQSVRVFFSSSASSVLGARQPASSSRARAHAAGLRTCTSWKIPTAPVLRSFSRR